MDVRFITTYICNQCRSPLTLWVRTPLRRGELDTTLRNKVCQWLATSLWFSLVSYTNKTDHHNITEILLKVAFSTINLNLQSIKCLLFIYCFLTSPWSVVVGEVTSPWSVVMEKSVLHEQESLLIWKLFLFYSCGCECTCSKEYKIIYIHCTFSYYLSFYRNTTVEKYHKNGHIFYCNFWF
jgi:hypothetical protein